MAFGSGLDNGDDVVSDINMVPLIDVMLVLLIIFIITVPVLTHSVKLDLPRADNTPQAIKPQSVNLSIAPDGAVFWNDEKLDEAQLQSKLEAAATGKKTARTKRRMASSTTDRGCRRTGALSLPASVTASVILRLRGWGQN